MNYVFMTILIGFNLECFELRKPRFLTQHIPILSSEMEPHLYSYRPRGFSIHTKKINEKKIVVEFNYTTLDVYNKYMIRMRYHGHQNDFATNKTILDRTESNKIILNDFPHAQYVLCVTLFPSMQVSGQIYPPISTSDMCVDIVFGEEVKINKHNKTGLLAPYLLTLVALHLILITIVYNLNQKFCGKHRKREEKQKQIISPYMDQITKLMNFSKAYAEEVNLANILLYYDGNLDKPIISNESFHKNLNTYYNQAYYSDSLKNGSFQETIINEDSSSRKLSKTSN